MKRPFTALEEESADSTSTAAPVSNHNFIGDDASAFQHPFNNRVNDAQNEDKDGSDSEDGLSDSSKRMRRKRNAYQKISDEIRVDLLDAVKNGETLKAAAKRHKINYSSAKSILHTYRKEGRILKKSAQERVTKKKAANNSENAKPYTKTSKSAKKDAEVDENSYNKPKSLEKITKKVKTEMYTNNPNIEEVQPLSQVSKNRANMSNHTENYPDNSSNKTVPTITIQKGEDYHHKLYNNDHDHTHDHGFSRTSSRKGSMQQFRLFDNFQVPYSDITFPDFSTMTGDHYDFNSYRRFSQDFASLNDMVHTMHSKTGTNDDHANNDHNAFFNNKGQNNQQGEDQKNSKVENLIDCDDHVKGFMDPQRMFRNNLRKASFLSFGSNTGFRKGSFDLY